MTRSKLSDLEKQEIVACFEQQQDTIPGLAERYQVSSSTIRRLLKQFASGPSDPEEAADEAAVSPPSVAASVPEPVAASGKVIVLDKKPKLIPKLATSAVQLQSQVPPESPTASAAEAESRPVTPPTLRAFREDISESRELTSGRRRSRVSSEEDVREIAANRAQEATIEPFEPEDTAAPSPYRTVTPPQEEMSAILEDLGSSLTSSFASAASDDDDEDDETFDDDYDADEDDLDDFSLTGSPLALHSEALLEVMPFAQAVLPKICYLVVDRTAELVTRPLKDFGELGQIPAHEVQSCTLPVFDNHRIARRFSHRTQRIIKVPNGNMLRSASTQLSAKGITRLLINGRIYAL
jgi:transposase-like protein